MDRLELFRNLMIMAAADGKFTEDELRFLGKRASRWGITDAEFTATLKYSVDANAHMTIPDDAEQRRVGRRPFAACPTSVHAMSHSSATR